jgi:hypothetical protein
MKSPFARHRNIIALPLLAFVISCGHGIHSVGAKKWRPTTREEVIEVLAICEAAQGMEYLKNKNVDWIVREGGEILFGNLEGGSFGSVPLPKMVCIMQWADKNNVLVLVRGQEAVTDHPPSRR